MAIPPLKKIATISKKASSVPAKTAAPTPKKNFTVKSWDDEKSGEKTIIYGESGMGKTTLLAQLDPVFIGLDDGGRKLRNPLTGKKLRVVPDIKTFQDVLDCLRTLELFKNEKDVAIDTATVLQQLGEVYTFENVRGPKEKPLCENMEDWGYGKGYKHLRDTMHLILVACDELVRRNINVYLIAQLNAYNKANAAGADYLQSGPNLYHDKKNSIRNDYCEWADHILMIDYNHVKADKGKASGSTERVIMVQPEVYFIAKSRTINERAVSFGDVTDTSIWQFMFPNRFNDE